MLALAATAAAAEVARDSHGVCAQRARRAADDDVSQRLLSTSAELLQLFRNVVLNAHYNWHNGTVDGSRFPPTFGKLAYGSMSMAGMRKLDHFVATVATAVEECVPGHVIETGVWRGGASLLAAKTLELLGAVERH
eukprot:7051745-Prymnesium_polylepis.1